MTQKNLELPLLPLRDIVVFPFMVLPLCVGREKSVRALEKSMASHGLLTLQPNEPDLLGYTDENLDAVTAFKAGSAPLLDWEYGLEIVRLTMAAYLSDERQKTIDLTDRSILEELENYIPLIQQGRGGEVL